MPAPIANTWKIQPLNANGTNNGPAQTLAALGIESATFDYHNLSADTLTFTVGGAEIDAATLWPYGTLLALIHPNGKRFFVGRVEPWTRDGQPGQQNHTGRLVNPWWYLEKLNYEQTYVVGGVDAEGNKLNPTVYTTPRCVLFILYNGNGYLGFYSATTGQQIADVLTWAIGKGAPIAIGQMDPATKPFSRYEQGPLCADVIKLCFRMEPDFVMDWDYTTLPFPTVHFRKAASMTPLEIDLTVPGVREAVQVKERPDWQKSYVKINYDQTNSLNGSQYLVIYQEWYSANGLGGTNNGAAYGAPLPADAVSNFNGVSLFCDLKGANVTSSQQTATFASLPFVITDQATWKAWKPSLAAPNVAQVIIMTPVTTPGTDANRPPPGIVCLDELDAVGNPVDYDSHNAFEVIDGEWADWIPNVTAQRVRVTAWACISNKNGEVRYEQLTHDMTVVSTNTNGVKQSFSANTTTNNAYAEPVQVGLSQQMWQSWQALAIEGSFKNVEQVIGATQPITRSNCLNFLTTNPGQNGQPDWRAVNARVQNISGDLGKGVTTVKFGAPLKITGFDLIEAIRATRYRVTTVDINYLFGGPLGGGAGGVTLGRKTHARSSQHGARHTQDQAISAAISPVAGVDPVVFTQGSSGITLWTPPGAPVSAGKSQPTVVVDPSKAKGDDGNWHSLGITQINVCTTINGVIKQRSMLVLGSGIFQGAFDPA